MPAVDPLLELTRRHFFGRCGLGIGSMALASLAGEGPIARASDAINPLAARPGHFPAKAKSVIYLFMAGGPSQFELFDPKPKLQEYHGQPIPESFVAGKRFAFMNTFSKERPKLPGDPAQVRPARPIRRPALGVPAAHGGGGGRPDVPPGGGDRADQPRAGEAFRQHRLAAIRPAEHGVVGHVWDRQRGRRPPRLRRPPVRAEGPEGRRGDWGNGLLPSTYQGVPLRNGAEPILDLANPPGIDATRQRRALDAIRDLNADASPPPATPRSPPGSPPTRWPFGCRRAPPS